MDLNISRKSTGIHCPASKSRSSGVMIGASKVDTEVIAIDKGTFPFARYTITLEAVPPGTQPSNTRPAANSAGKFMSLAIRNATDGMMINWAQTPIITGSGLVMMILKSTAFKVSPIPNMTTPSNIVMNPPIPKMAQEK